MIGRAVFSPGVFSGRRGWVSVAIGFLKGAGPIFVYSLWGGLFLPGFVSSLCGFSCVWGVSYAFFGFDASVLSKKGVVPTVRNS